MKITESDKKRFWAKVDIKDDDDCWLWRTYCDKGGYGRFVINNQSREAHRIAWMIVYGDIPKDFCVCHKCDVPNCVNPKHLFVGTQRDNIQDCIAKDRRAKLFGSEVATAILTEQEVTKIKYRLLNKETCTAIARSYNVDRTTISKIKCNKNWQQIHI